jgi:hypothetical protein
MTAATDSNLRNCLLILFLPARPARMAGSSRERAASLTMGATPTGLTNAEVGSELVREPRRRHIRNMAGKSLSR